jgi:hypothetical protein
VSLFPSFFFPVVQVELKRHAGTAWFDHVRRYGLSTVRDNLGTATHRTSDMYAFFSFVSVIVVQLLVLMRTNSNRHSGNRTFHDEPADIHPRMLCLSLPLPRILLIVKAKTDECANVCHDCQPHQGAEATIAFNLFRNLLSFTTPFWVNDLINNVGSIWTVRIYLYLLPPPPGPIKLTGDG